MDDLTDDLDLYYRARFNWRSGEGWSCRLWITSMHGTRVGTGSTAREAFNAAHAKWQAWEGED